MGRYSWLRGSRGHALRELVRISLALSLCDPQRMARERPARGRGPYSIGPAPPREGVRHSQPVAVLLSARLWRRKVAAGASARNLVAAVRLQVEVDPLGEDLRLLGVDLLLDGRAGHLGVLDRSLASSHAKKVRVSLPFFSVYGSRPKWQYAAVTLYLGWHSWRSRARAPGRASKLSLTMLVIDSGVRLPCSVPYVSTKRESGFATPMAYDSCTSARLHRPDLTADLAIQRQA